jgi:hypothetical protein
MRLSQLGFNCVVGLLFCFAFPFGVLRGWRFIFSQFPWYLKIMELAITLIGIFFQTFIIFFMGSLGRAIKEGTDGTVDVNLDEPEYKNMLDRKPPPHLLAALLLVLYIATYLINGDLTSGISHLNSSVMGMFTEPSIEI